jgi:hypothetical protein
MRGLLRRRTLIRVRRNYSRLLPLFITSHLRVRADLTDGPRLNPLITACGTDRAGTLRVNYVLLNPGGGGGGCSL